jgi:hypothetical protein
MPVAVSSFGSSQWSAGGERLRRCVQAGATTGERRPPEAAEMGVGGGGSASDADRVCPSTADLSRSSLPPQPHSFELARGQSQRRTEPGAQGCTRYNRCERHPAAGREGQRNPGSDSHRSREMFHVEPERAAGRRAPRRARDRHPIRTLPGPLTLRSLTPGPVSPRRTGRIGRPRPTGTCPWRRTASTHGPDLRWQGDGVGLARSLRRPNVRLRCWPPPAPGAAGGRTEPRP